MNKLNFIIFIVIFSSLYLGMNYFVYSRIANGLVLSQNFKALLKIFFLFASLSFLLPKYIIKSSIFNPILIFGKIWFSFVAIAFSIFFLAYIAGIIFPKYMKILTFTAIVLTVFISAYGLFNGMKAPLIKEIKVQIKKLPDKLNGFTIIQLSDLHLDKYDPIKKLDSIVNRINQTDPDLIVITGDLVDENLKGEEIFISSLQKLSSKYGTFAVTGNHEFYFGVDNFIKMAKDSGIKVLRNKKELIYDWIQLIGIEERTGKRLGNGGPNLEEAMQGVDLEKPLILLNHRPEDLEKAEQRGIDLQLSGHSHAGQIFPINLISMMIYNSYYYGLHKYKSMQVYTTSGAGTWGPPMRLFSRSEIVKIILVKS